MTDPIVLMRHGNTIWTVCHTGSQYQWTLQVGRETAHGVASHRPDALRDLADALERLAHTPTSDVR